MVTLSYSKLSISPEQQPSGVSFSTLMVMLMALARALLPFTSRSRGKLSSGNLEDK